MDVFDIWAYSYLDCLRGIGCFSFCNLSGCSNLHYCKHPVYYAASLGQGFRKDVRRFEKPRNPYYRYLYYLLSGNKDAAAQFAKKMEEGPKKEMALAMLYLKEKQITKASDLLFNM